MHLWHSFSLLRPARFCLACTWLGVLGAPSSGAQGAAQQIAPTAAPKEFTLEADKQRQEGKISYADGNVDVRYEDTRLRADHLVYDDEKKTVTARGHVQLDYLTQHVEADEGTYDLRTGQGSFRRVRATFAIQRRPTPNLLISPNPIYFEADETQRMDNSTYVIHKAWVTVCDPGKPTWKFYAPRATVRMDKSVHLEGANFRLFSVPLLYFPFATLPAGRRRQSGFLIPDIGDSTRKGFIFGDMFYWAPSDWMDGTAGADYLSKRGWSQRAGLRVRPWENAQLDASYFGVEDRGLPQTNLPPLRQGGHEWHFDFDAPLGQGWRGVADLNELSSLTFRLAFAETFSQAVNSEVRNTAFLTNHFEGFSVSLAGLGYKNFFSASPETFVTLRTTPEARLDSVEQAPFRHLPLYLAFVAFGDAVHREDTITPFATPDFVQRSELAPRVLIPLRWGPWLGLTPAFTLRSTHYGAQLTSANTVLSRSFFRTTEELTLDVRPPSLARVWEGSQVKWKHTIEPEVTYRYVQGVGAFSRYIRFDEDETLTDTSEVQYGVTQRLLRRGAEGDAEELASWSIREKYFFDPTFGGALTTGQRNVFQAFDSLTPFAFADSPRRFSPIVSDLRITPGGRYDAQLRVDFDPKRGQLTAIGSLVKLKPYRASFLTLAHFSTINLPPTNALTGNFQPRSNQVRLLLGYGELARPGWNAALGFSYDVAQRAFQNQVVQLSYNGSCCGIGLEFRRLTLGNVRSENQFRLVLLIANLGSAGNLRRQEKIF